MRVCDFFKKGMIVSALLTLTLGVGYTKETRCGWYTNSSPDNLSLTDKAGTWWITSQNEANGPDVKNAEKAPEFDPNQFIETNVPGTGYGYGCACLKVETQATTHRITVVYSGKVLPLSVCKKDKSLQSPEE